MDEEEMRSLFLEGSIINLHGRDGWEEEKDSGMQTVPAVTPLTSRGRLASWGVNPATCQDLILLQVSESFPQTILLLRLLSVVCELILCRPRPRQTLHKMASALLCEDLLAQ